MKYKEFKQQADSGLFVKIKNITKPKEIMFIKNDFGDSIEFVCDDGATYKNNDIEKIL